MAPLLPPIQLFSHYSAECCTWRTAAVCLSRPPAHKLDSPEVWGLRLELACSVVQPISIGWSQWVGLKQYYGFIKVITVWVPSFWILFTDIDGLVVGCHTWCPLAPSGHQAPVVYVSRKLFLSIGAHFTTNIFHSAVFNHQYCYSFIQSITPESVRHAVRGGRAAATFRSLQYTKTSVCLFFSSLSVSGSPVATSRAAQMSPFPPSSSSSSQEIRKGFQVSQGWGCNGVSQDGASSSVPVCDAAVVLYI